MDIYFSFQGALCFSIAHILIRRGLVESNAMTGSFISLSMSAVLLWILVPFFAPLSALWSSGRADLRHRRNIRSRHRPHSELRGHREDRCGAIGADRQLVADLRVDLRRDFSRRSLGAAEYRRHATRDRRYDRSVALETSHGRVAQARCHLSVGRRHGVRGLGDSPQGRLGSNPHSGVGGSGDGRLGGALFICAVAGSRRQGRLQAEPPKRRLAVSRRRLSTPRRCSRYSMR